MKNPRSLEFAEKVQTDLKDYELDADVYVSQETDAVCIRHRSPWIGKMRNLPLPIDCVEVVVMLEDGDDNLLEMLGYIRCPSCSLNDYADDKIDEFADSRSPDEGVLSFFRDDFTDDDEDSCHKELIGSFSATFPDEDESIGFCGLSVLKFIPDYCEAMEEFAFFHTPSYNEFIEEE